MKILYLTSSILNEHSVSNLLSNQIVKNIEKKYPSALITKRDLGLAPPSHLSFEVATAIRSKDISTLNEEQKKDYLSILESINQLKDADIIVIGSPMYNLSISSGLKTWIDQICQAGLTFSYSENGPKGLVNNKPVIIVSSRGGIYTVPPLDKFDHQEPYLTSVFGLIGITDITFIRAEGININEKTKQESLNRAREEIEKLNI